MAGNQQHERMKFFKTTIITTILATVLNLVAYSQANVAFLPAPITERLRSDVFFLASDSLEGRESGTTGERMAAEYLAERMKEIGLEPLFDGSYIQEFTFMSSITLGDENQLSIGTRLFTLHECYQVIAQSGNGLVSGTGVYVGHGIDGEQGFSDYEHVDPASEKVFFMEYFAPSGYNDSKGLSDAESLTQRINMARKRGAEAVILVNTNDSIGNPRLGLRSRGGRYDFPVIFASTIVFEFFQLNPDLEINFTVDLYQDELVGHNVAGYLDNNSPTTVVIGGHFDHIGYGGASSRAQGEPQVHPGADDNASGTAGVLEAALYLINSNLRQNNYIFIAFGAEEKGLIGSRFFAESDVYPLDKINYMFNFDMIGRLEDGKISLIGTGSSEQWDTIVQSVDHVGLVISKSPGALGGSDHTSFYTKEIPVIFFFTGIHEDYHRPSDTADKINFEGMVEILNFAYRLVEKVDDFGRLAYSPAGSQQPSRRRTEGVTFGLMPDHGYGGEGVRIQAVVDDRPAQRSGLQNGDVIVKINEKEIHDIHSYMQVLADLKSGEKVVVEVRRGEESKSIEVSL